MRFIVFLCFVFVVGCSQNNETIVVITSCQDEFGIELDTQIPLLINGVENIWTPGQDLITNISVQNNNKIEIENLAEGYTLISPNVYDVNPSVGIEIVLAFKAKDSDAKQDEISDQVDQSSQATLGSETLPVQPVPQTEIAPGRYILSVTPLNAELIIRDNSNNNEVFKNSGVNSHEVTLAPGVYNWQVQASGYTSQSGRVTIRSEISTRNQVDLEEIIIYGSVSIQISPQNASVKLTRISNNNEVEISNGSIFQIPVGEYRLNASAPGYSDFTTTVRVSEGQESVVARNLISVRVDDITSRIQGINTLTQAIGINNTLPSAPIPNISLQQRVQYYNSLQQLASYLYSNGESTAGINLYRKIVREDPNKIDSRLDLARILINNRDYEESRSIARPIYGALINSVPNDDREIVALTARYLVALSYYEEFNNISSTNFSRRNEIGGQAYSALQDFISRYNSSRTSRVQEAKRLHDDAVIYRNIIGTELGL